MALQRKIGIAYVLVCSLVLVAPLGSAFTTRRSGVSVRVVDKRLTIQEVRLFIGTNVNYLYVPPLYQPKYQCQRVLDALGIAQPWKRYNPPKIRGKGPALVIRGRLEAGDTIELCLVPEGQFDANPYNTLPRRNGLKGSTFIWEFPLRFINDFGEPLVTVTNGIFHMRQSGESNDLAVIEIR